MADNLLSLYTSLAYPEIEMIKNRIYEGSSILDIFLKKKYMEETRQDLTKNTVLKLPTYTGYSRRLFNDTGYALTNTEATTGIWSKVNDEVKLKQLTASGTVGEVIPAHINLGITINKERLMQIEELFKAKKDKELQDAINGSLTRVKADLYFGIAWAIMNGQGGNSNQYNTVTNAPTKLFTDGLTAIGSTYTSFNSGAGLPATRQIEGIYPYVLNPYYKVAPSIGGVTQAYGVTTNGGSSKLWGIDLTDAQNQNWNPTVYDFFTGDSATPTKLSYAPFGYNTTAIGTGWGLASSPYAINASKLMGRAGGTTTMTDGVPAIIDIISQVINDRRVNGLKPTFGLCRRDMYQLIVRALKASQWGSANATYGSMAPNDKAPDLVKMGYEDHIVIDGVAIIPDDQKRYYWDANGNKQIQYVCPANAIMFLNTDSMVFEAHKDYNFIEDSDWVKVPGVNGQFVKEINATVRFSIGDREAQTLIQFGAINYSA